MPLAHCLACLFLVSNSFLTAWHHKTLSHTDPDHHRLSIIAHRQILSTLTEALSHALGHTAFCCSACHRFTEQCMTVLVCALKHCHQIRKQAEVCRTRCSTIRLCQMSSSPPNERTGALPRCIRSAACPALCLLNSSPADMTNMHAICPSILYCDFMQLQKTEGLRSSAWLDTPLSVAACQSLGRWQPSVSAYVVHDVLCFLMMAIL